MSASNNPSIYIINIAKENMANTCSLQQTLPQALLMSLLIPVEQCHI
jgi:hypothetical protein